jgi:Zn finger protein HypA/HybF involved in hydrogenase expression
MATVELRQAYHWHCEECGSENFALPQKAELTDEQREAAYRHFNQLDQWAELPEQWRNFQLVHIPETVQCSQCKATFETIDEQID